MKHLLTGTSKETVMKHLLTFLWLVAALNAYASDKNEKTSIVTLNNNNGLSNSAVNVTYQDREGIMWFGTWDGLNRYDGSSVYRYNNRENDAFSLSHQIIRDISEDNVNHLWITTDYGINRLDKRSGRIDRFFLDYKPGYIYQENSFTCQAAANGVIAASFYAQGLYLFDSDENKFHKCDIANSNRPPQIHNLLFDEKNTLWIQTGYGTVMRVEIQQGKTPVMTHEIQLPSDDHSRLIYDHGKFLWFSANGTLHNINIYNPVPEINNTGIPVDGNLQAAFAHKSHVLLGTSTGCYRLENNRIERYLDITTPVLSIFIGTQGVTWIGTDGKGVYQCYARPGFISYVDPSRYGSSNNYPVRAIIKDRSGKIWVGTKGGGLSHISHLGAQGLEKSVNLNVGAGRTYNSVLSMAQGHGRIWIGTDGNGLLYCDEASGNIKSLNLPTSDKGRAIKSVYCILQPDSATLYLGTSGNGLFKLSLDKQQEVTGITNFRHSDNGANSLGSNIVYALADDHDHIWAATRGGGLNRINKHNNNIETFSTNDSATGSICSNDVITLLKDSRNRLWAGTTSGVSMLENCDAEQKIFRTFDTKSGLPNANIHAIIEDHDHNIWFSTSQGLARMDGNDYQVASFFYEDGLQDNEFSDGAGFASSDGSALFFGGVNGFNIIYPAHVSGKDFMPGLILKGVCIDNIPYELSDNTLTASYKANAINIDFAITDYIDNRKCKILYKLESHSFIKHNETSEWVDLGSNRNIVLNQLPPGKYKLSVKVANARMASGKPLEFFITVTTPIWSTWWAIGIYLLLTILIIITVFRVKRGRLLIQHELAMAKLEKINKEKTHQAKLRFFTNIAHEFSNSITLIYGAVEQVLAKGNPDEKLKKQLLTIKSNAERMRQQIQELMEFRKAEQGYLHVKLEKADIPSLIACTADNFIDIADSKHITLNFDISPSLTQWIVDKNMLEKIIFNLLSNALKYTPEHGTVQINAGITDSGILSISCSNSGPGIPAGNLQHVFNRFTVLDNFERKLSQGQYSRNGIGLALCKDLVTLMGGTISVSSEIGQYTVFTVELPFRSDNEIVQLLDKDTSDLPLQIPQETADSRFGIQSPAILIVDDQKEIRDMIADILDDRYETIMASNGKEALEALKSSAPSLIICDIIMPEMNGIDFIEHIKQDERTKYIPIIILSSKSDIESRIAVLETGANMFVNKPFHPQYLKAAVDNILQNHSMMKQFSESASAYKERYNNTMIAKDDKEFIDSVIDTLSKKFSDENYNQDSLAADLAISRIQLYRKIKRIANTTPGEFIRSFRLGQAEKMLLHSEKTIQEIITDCGFHNKAYFYRIFQKAHDCSPKEFRKEHDKSIPEPTATDTTSAQPDIQQPSGNAASPF